jgi:hypothetical protein
MLARSRRRAERLHQRRFLLRDDPVGPEPHLSHRVRLPERKLRGARVDRRSQLLILYDRLLLHAPLAGYTRQAGSDFGVRLGILRDEVQATCSYNKYGSGIRAHESSSRHSVSVELPAIVLGDQE